MKFLFGVEREDRRCRTGEERVVRRRREGLKTVRCRAELQVCVPGTDRGENGDGKKKKIDE